MDLSLASVLLAGFVVSIEPCALTVDLLIIGYITGAEDDDKVSTGWIRGFLAGLAFIAGRSITYAAMGVSAAFIGIHASSTVQAYSGMAAEWQRMTRITRIWLPQNQSDFTEYSDCAC